LNKLETLKKVPFQNICEAKKSIDSFFPVMQRHYCLELLLLNVLDVFLHHRRVFWLILVSVIGRAQICLYRNINPKIAGTGAHLVIYMIGQRGLGHKKFSTGLAHKPSPVVTFVFKTSMGFQVGELTGYK